MNFCAVYTYSQCTRPPCVTGCTGNYERVVGSQQLACLTTWCCWHTSIIVLYSVHTHTLVLHVHGDLLGAYTPLTQSTHTIHSHHTLHIHTEPWPTASHWKLLRSDSTNLTESLGRAILLLWSWPLTPLQTWRYISCCLDDVLCVFYTLLLDGLSIVISWVYSIHLVWLQHQWFPN